MEVIDAYSSNIVSDVSAVRACNDRGNTAHACNVEQCLVCFLFMV
jgi:hypothetical protein